MNLIEKFINKRTLTIEDLKKKDIYILCATTTDYYSLMNYFHKKNLRWLSNDLPYEYIPEQLEVNNKPVYVKFVENKGVEVFQNIDEVIKYVGEDLESAYHWVFQNWDWENDYSWEELVLILKKIFHDFTEEDDDKKYHINIYKRYNDRIEIE